MRKQPGKIKFVLTFGLISFIPLVINYYVFKLLVITFFLKSFSWSYSLIELLFVSIACMLFGSLFCMYVQSKRKINVNV